jgi:hypothetical protein
MGSCVEEIFSRAHIVHEKTRVGEDFHHLRLSRGIISSIMMPKSR